MTGRVVPVKRTCLVPREADHRRKQNRYRRRRSPMGANMRSWIVKARRSHRARLGSRAMAEIAPLTPLRYDLSRIDLEKVVAPPYDVISPEEREDLAARDPENVVRLILPEGEGDTRYAHAAEILSSMRERGVLVRDDEPGYYRYDQTFKAAVGGGETRRITRKGFLAAVRLAPFSDRIVLPHERTLSGPKEDRLKLFRATGTNLSPGFMLYRDAECALNGPLDRAKLLVEFLTSDGVVHRLSKVKEEEAIRAITAKVAESSLLIADGHHRYETAVRYAGEVAEQNPSAPLRAEFRYFMTFLSNGDDPGLVVFPTHRHAHSLTGFSFDELLKRAKDLFEVTVLETKDAGELVRELDGAGKTGTSFIACAPDGRSALLRLRSDAKTKTALKKHPALVGQVDALQRTDIALLHGTILESLCGITKEAQAAKTNLYYPQNAGKALAELRGGKGDVLFLMNPTPASVVREVAEAGEVMPQKSTFFFPKVLTGLAIHTLDPSRVVA